MILTSGFPVIRGLDCRGVGGWGIPRNFHEFPLMSLLLSTVIITCILISELSLTMMLKVEGTVSVCRVGTKEEMLCIFLTIVVTFYF